MKKFLAFAAALAFLPALAAAQEGGKINVTLLVCRELLCASKADLFLLNESAYIDYNSSVREISYSAIFTFPDGAKYQAMLPNRITTNMTGNYTIEFIAWKEGYEETRISKTIQFVEKMPEPANPATLDWVPVLAALGAGLTVFVAWRVYSRRKKPREEKPEKKKARKHD